MSYLDSKIQLSSEFMTSDVGKKLYRINLNTNKLPVKNVARKLTKCHTDLMKVVAQLYNRTPVDKPVNLVNFDRKELSPILKTYGQLVTTGNWRDYSISSSSTNAIFSIFRRSSENPFYMIMKTPRLRKQNRMYSVLAMNGQILKQGGDLQFVLQILNKKLFTVL